jgi:DNA polymerase-3 subunit delta'
MWQDIIGQERVKRILRAAVESGRVPHAYLFYGGEGVGKDAMALEFARLLRCERGGAEACMECVSCRQITAMDHPDVRFIAALPVGKGEESGDDPLAKLTQKEVQGIQEQFREKGKNPYLRLQIPRANVIKINSVRELRWESSLSTSGRMTRIIIISRAEEMEAPAANTLLKTLEEPHPNTVLILTSARPDALLPTIRSRCQHVRFDPLREEDLRQALVAREGVESEHARLVARLANGSYTHARALLQEDVMQLRQDVVDFVLKAVSDRVTDLTEAVEKVAASRDRDEALLFLTLMQVWFRDAMVLPYGGTVINVDQQDRLEKFLAWAPGADLAGALAEVEKAFSLVDRYGYIKLTLLRLAIRLREAILPGRPAKKAAATT